MPELPKLIRHSIHYVITTSSHQLLLLSIISCPFLEFSGKKDWDFLKICIYKKLERRLVTLNF